MKKWIALVLFGAAGFAAEPEAINLYPGAAPGSEGSDWQEEEFVGPRDTLHRVRNVTRPTLTPYVAERPNGTAIVVCPGGGFRHLAIDHEGRMVVRWLNGMGVTALLLKYRLMRTVENEPPAAARERRKAAIPLAVADGLQAMRLARARAAEWGVARDRIGIMGFSAGGYVAAAVAMTEDAGSRPDFAAPIYPATPEEIAVPKGAPPLFLALADDDRTVPPVPNGVRLYAAWRNAGLPAELHIYSRGGHGFGLLKNGLPVEEWIDRFRDWMKVQGFLKPAR